MKPESVTDTPYDITLNRGWIFEQVDRLIAWEIFCRGVTHKSGLPILPYDLCDMISAPSMEYISHILRSAKNKVNEK
jgi:hypothetical protein